MYPAGVSYTMVSLYVTNEAAPSASQRFKESYDRAIEDRIAFVKFLCVSYYSGTRTTDNHKLHAWVFSHQRWCAYYLNNLGTYLQARLVLSLKVIARDEVGRDRVTPLDETFPLLVR